MPRKTLALLLFVLLWIFYFDDAHAQDTADEPQTIDWQELETNYFLIVFAETVTAAGEEIECYCGLSQAQGYADFVDDVYGDLATVFGAELETPVNLLLFPTEQSYFEVNPLAANLTGVIAHAANDRQEIAIALPRTRGLGQDELENNVRHEVTHLFASRLSQGKLGTGFQEGIAQYLEKPNSDGGYAPAVLLLATQEDRLLTWAELDEVQEVYSDPQVAYPQTLSIVSFLVDRYGFPALLHLVKAAATGPGYRSALEAAYDKSADELETEWLAYLPEYLEGRWKINAIYTYDLSRVTELVVKGAYTAAREELLNIIALLATTEQHDTLAQAEFLLGRVSQAKAAAVLAEDARRALQVNDYSQAIEKGTAALSAYERVGYGERHLELQTYIYRAERGQQALEQLKRGERLMETLRFSEAETAMFEATALLQTLNNPDAARRGEQLLNELDTRQRVLAYGLLAMGLATVLFNALRRAIARLRPEPLEVNLP